MHPTTSSPTFREAWFAPPTKRRALKVSALVGTALIIINQGDLLLQGALPPLWKIPMTYFVPYAVSSWSSASAIVEGARERMQSAASASADGTPQDTI